MTSQNQPKVAITVQKYFHPGQTFVNRHIRHLFGGNTCVITERLYDTPDEANARPNFCVGKEIMNAHDIFRLPFYLSKNRREFHAYRVPQGRMREQMKAFIKDQGVNAILSEFGSQSMLVADVGREMNIPVFCYFRGRDASYWIHDKMRVAAYKKTFPQLAGIFAVSQYLLDNLASVGVTHPNAHVVPSGTDIDQFKPAKKDPNLLLAVGRFVGKKYPELTIRCFLEAKKDFPDARLEMVGGGPELKKCQALVDELGAQNSVILHGKQSSDFVASKLAHASIFVQHSVVDKTGEAEGLPSSIQEAMAAGCAIISTEHAGIPELVHQNETGLLSPELDEPAFIQNIKSMLANSAGTAQMGKNARTLAESRIDYRILYQKVESVISKSL